MKIFDRVRPELAQSVKSVKEVNRIYQKWWRAYDSQEVYPKGYVPIYFTVDMRVKKLEDDDLCVVPKSGSWATYKEIGYYVCARASKVKQAKLRYEDNKAWRKLNWRGKLIS